MKIVLTLPISGIVVQYNGLADLAQHYTELAMEQRRQAGIAPNQKTTRFHEGQAVAYDNVATGMKLMTMAIDLPDGDVPLVIPELHSKIDPI